MSGRQESLPGFSVIDFSIGHLERDAKQYRKLNLSPISVRRSASHPHCPAIRNHKGCLRINKRNQRVKNDYGIHLYKTLRHSFCFRMAEILLACGALHSEGLRLSQRAPELQQRSYDLISLDLRSAQQRPIEHPILVWGFPTSIPSGPTIRISSLS